MKAILQISTFLFFIICGSTPAHSCSCADPSQRQRFRSADAVFLGEVIEYNQIPEADYKRLTGGDPNKSDLALVSHRVVLRVEKQWKGKKKSQITALANWDNPGWCGDLDLSVGRRVLIYAPRIRGELVIYRDCGPNREADYAKDEISNLNNIFFRAYVFLSPYPKL